jgi:hemerythrin
LITQEQLPMVAIPSMNDTHLEEMLIINKLEKAARSRDIDGVADALDELLEHTLVHFSNEDKMMEEAKFPAYATHKAEHDRHLHELKSLVKYFAKNREPNAVIAYIDGNLVRWMIHHIETMDTVTANFLKEQLV